MPGGGDVWPISRELLERGDPAFVDRLRAITDADALAQFAEQWYDDRSPGARRLLLAYLERPINAYRHEAFVKRLFKRAEAAGDDAVMARFLVAFDRSIRRAVRLRALGIGGELQVSRMRNVLMIVTPRGTTMPRGDLRRYFAFNPEARRFEPIRAPDWVGKLRLDQYANRDAVKPPESKRPELERFRLFSLPTRRYLRRRAWRHFRKLGKTHPARYVEAVVEALALYEDADVVSGLALIDNWGLIHALFHHSPVLEAGPRGWKLAKGRSLAELEPAPIYEEAWRAAPRSMFELLARARCRPVRQWALRMLRRSADVVRAAVGVEDIIGLLAHHDAEAVALALEWLRGAGDVSSLPPERWVAVLETANPGALEPLVEIVRERITPDPIPLEAVMRLAAARPLPLARLGLGWLRARGPVSDQERRGLLVLLEAECESIRPELLAWLRSTLSATPEIHSDWLLEFLDSRHADTRAVGMAWFREDPRARDDVILWRCLMESPHDDVRLAMSAELEARLERARRGGAGPVSQALDPDRLRLLWASVLLNVNRGNRAKPGVMEQVADHLTRRPDEAELLLPLLAIGLRSIRATERRAALAAVVRLVERRPESFPLVNQWFPELQWA